MSWRTASYFSSRPAAATNSSYCLTAIPIIPEPIGEHPHSQRHAQTGAPAQTTGIFPKRKSLAFLIENLCTAPLCPLLALCGARFPHFWSPRPASKYIYIDAFNGKFVTRKTLLRYTFKCCGVNILIRGFVWKTAALRNTLTSDLGEESTWHRRSHTSYGM